MLESSQYVAKEERGVIQSTITWLISSDALRKPVLLTLISMWRLAKAMKVLQSKLEPLERAVYLLKEVFDFDYEALQEALDKKKDHCRQLLCRAKKKLEDETSKINFEFPDKSQLYGKFSKGVSLGQCGMILLLSLKRMLPAILLRNQC